MNPIERRIQQTCRAAALDLSVRVTTPFSLFDSFGKQCEFLARFEDFGGQNGVLICHADKWVIKNPTAVQQGYFCSGLHPESYETYDRSCWIEAFEEWRWHGPPRARPSWYHE